MKKYTILMYNFGRYEIMREPEEMDPECEYIYVTDDPSCKSDKWSVIYEPHNYKSVFEKCYEVRFNLFNYATTDVCIYMDASIQLHKSLRKLYDDFMASGADIGLNIHPLRYNLEDEYHVWEKCRGYSRWNTYKCLTYMRNVGYDLDYKGLYQGTCRICKRTEENQKLDALVLTTLHRLAVNGEIERQDQNIYSFVINHYYNNLKVFPFSQQVLQSEYATWCAHNSVRPNPVLKENDEPKYVFNELRDLYHI